LQTASASEIRQPAAPYVVPFAVFLGLLAIQEYVPLPQRTEFGLRLVVLAAVLWFCSRRVISFRVRSLLPTLGIGAAVFLIWIAPDSLFPGYRSHWLFHNSITGTARGSLPVDGHTDVWLLAFRTLRAVIVVPIIEELFWRAWLMRWLIHRDFWKVPLGAFQSSAFWLTAVLFASEHGPYWEVGLIAGLVYNGWMVRTRSLGDLILAHAVTNGLLSAYVIAANRWEYWL
jgi:hypothetical protein